MGVVAEDDACAGHRSKAQACFWLNEPVVATRTPVELWISLTSSLPMLELLGLCSAEALPAAWAIAIEYAGAAATVCMLVILVTQDRRSARADGRSRGSPQESLHAYDLVRGF